MQTAAACALALCLAGCGGNNPKPSPAPSASATSASPSGEVAPTMPAEAKGTDEAAAKAYVQHFVATLNYAGNSGQTGELRALYSPTCLFCEGIADGLDRVNSNGGSYKSDGWTIKSFSPTSIHHGRIQILATVQVSPQTVVPAKGAKPRHFPGQTNGQRRFTLKLKQNNWIVSNLADPT